MNKSFMLDESDLENFHFEMTHTLVLINHFDDNNFILKLEQLLRKNQALCYQEVESPFYKEIFPSEIIYDEQVQNLLRNGKIKHILRIGSTSDSKFWRLLETEFNHIPVTHLTVFNKPSLSRGAIWPFHLRDKILNKIDAASARPIEDKSNYINNLISAFPSSELALFKKQIDHIDKPGNILFIGNSLPIRHLKYFKPKFLEIYANRGANGIDGLLATAAGVAKANKQGPVHVILGDLSFMYDFSSLFGMNCPNLHIHLINNSGGKIFDRLTSQREIFCEHSFFFEPWKLNEKFNLGSFIEIRPDFAQTDQLTSSLNLFWKEEAKEVEVAR
jgi:2-succinyl-5-enolpyruvyl-6-hydroxy-3-cyclohexene-1-carboxylate synthase